MCVCVCARARACERATCCSMHRHRHMMIGDNECNEMAWYGHGPLRVPRRLLAPSIISVTEVRTIRGAGAPASLAPRAHAASGANGPQGGPTGLLPWLPNHQTQLLLRSFLCCRLACFARLHGRGTSRDHAVFFPVFSVCTAAFHGQAFPFTVYRFLLCRVPHLAHG